MNRRVVIEVKTNDVDAPKVARLFATVLKDGALERSMCNFED